MGETHEQQKRVLAVFVYFQKKSSIYFVILSLIRNIELRSKLLPLGKTKKNLRFILLFSRLYVTLLRKVFKTEP